MRAAEGLCEGRLMNTFLVDLMPIITFTILTNY